MDVFNKHGVSLKGDQIALLIPPAAFVPMSKDEALTLAAWLVVLADPLGERFEEIISAVENT